MRSEWYIKDMKTPFEFHISRRARDRYGFDQTFFSTDGRLIFPDASSPAGLGAARRFVGQIYAVSGRSVPASDIYAMSLIEEVLHLVVRQYERRAPDLMGGALAFLNARLGAGLDETLSRFTDEFPPSVVYRRQQSASEYLSGLTGGRSHRQISLEEMLLVHIANTNPALASYREFFDDSVLNGTAYGFSISLLGEFFARGPRLGNQAGAGGETLYEALLAPGKASPHSLDGQLQFLLERWGNLFDEDILKRFLLAMDFVREEAIRQAGPPGFQPTAEVPSYGDYPEYERFSLDKDWMPRLVLMAKNTYVWLEQLSRKYGRWIKTLDQIPDEELDLLAGRGFTGLWLIGLWERSRASQRIKQRMGAADAVASAYSLYSYDIASDLGGWNALENLRSRAWGRGLRLSADMVPNHMGIDSAWVIEHPDWFLSLDEPPYPSYSFNSENLSDDSRVAIVLEDHYYDHSDASVVFKLHHYDANHTRYVYHGNDGTSFPWNDTAQLDYSKAEVREAVIQTILHVARNFPVIRFDAAMTLAKKHIERLWFPEPGSGGAIPSRVEHGMSRAEFEAAIPQEFWREVVDRVAAEVPDTLLLAEAFWMMEGYFVRTLGMHRVYNSAFMHMLRDEDNAKYRKLIKDTLEFDPQILRRYVNFMNNPDEKTAIEQFGDGDKYFGVCTLLATLPGLPMFGHGQVEGYREKYGMEFRMPKMDEQPNEGLVDGHDWKIFPLLHRRHLFADVENFLLYDLYRADGHVDENVFAYSNQSGEQRGLVIFHNKFAETRGWIKTSAAYVDKRSGDLRQKSLAEGLGMPYEGFVIFRDYVTHLEYIRSCEDLWFKGLYVELGAYRHHAFLDWRFVEDERWQIVCNALNGAGVESIQTKWDELVQPEATSVTEPKPKKPRKKASAKKTVKKKEAKAGKPRKKTVTKSKKPAKKTKKTTTKKSAVKGKKSAARKEETQAKKPRTKSSAKKTSSRSKTHKAEKAVTRKKSSQKNTDKAVRKTSTTKKTAKKKATRSAKKKTAGNQK